MQGEVSYLPTGPDLNRRDAAGRLVPVTGFSIPTFPRPAPRMPVEILRLDGTLLGTTLTADDGTYSLRVNFGPVPATQVVVRVRATMTLPFGTTVRVLPDAGAAPYAIESPPSGNPASMTMTVDLMAPLDGAAGAFHILDVLYEGFITAKSGIAATMPDLDVVWRPGNGDTSAFVAGAQRGTLTIAGGAAGDPASNQDVWDEPQIMRLLGLYLLEYFFHEVAPDGTPDDKLLVPSAAWREGFLDFWACAGRNSPQFWDTEGIGASGRVVRYFHIESFFDPSLGRLGPDDPNVYQEPSVVGIGSRFSVAEVLWDIHDSATQGDADGVEFPLFLTLRLLRNAVPGSSYPYVVTLLDEYTREGDLDPVTIKLLLRDPEDQAIDFPATATNGSRWPVPFPHSTTPGAALAAPFDATLSDVVDTTPPGTNLDLGLFASRYFTFTLGADATARLTLTTSGALELDLLDFENSVVARGPSPLVVPALEPRSYVVRVRSVADPQLAPFDLRLELLAP